MEGPLYWVNKVDANNMKVQQGRDDFIKSD